MIFRRSAKNKINSKELLKQIEAELARGNEKNDDLLIAKTIITSRLTSMRDSGKIPL
jgi:hypothetical protein